MNSLEIYSSDTTHLPNWLKRCAENTPTKIAVYNHEQNWTFTELDRQATQLAYQFAAQGVRKGSRVAVLIGSNLTYVACVHALMRLEAILVPLNLRLTLEEHRWLVHDVQTSLLVSDADHTIQARNIAQAIDGIAQVQIKIAPESGNVVIEGDVAQTDVQPVPLADQIDLNATAIIMYTSGTTGTPKGVLMTNGMLWWNTIGSALNLGNYADDCWLVCVPLFHISGLSILIKSVIYGISIVLHEKFDATTVNKAICEQRVTIISVVAIMLQRMLAELNANQQQYPAALRCVLLGGGPAPKPLLEECASYNIPVVQSYGLTESCSQAVTLSPADALRKLGSAGRPLLPVQIRIMDEDKPAQPGQPGVIQLKGPSITAGYDHRPEATAAVIHDGWLSTGDIGYLDTEGYLYVLDRRSDLIISGGENIYPAEVESALLSHPDVKEVGVCGLADSQWGQVPIAFVCLKEGRHTPSDEIINHVAHRLARYKLPRTVYIVGQLPRNSSGKLLRRQLPQLLANQEC